MSILRNQRRGQGTQTFPRHRAHTPARRRAGTFIVLEGPDKCGKSTQAALLARRLKGFGKKVVHTREPGGTSFAEAIRNVLLDPKHRVHPLAELLLYEAARAQHTHELLLPALNAGAVVICERYTLATLVYQGFARKLDESLIRRLNAIATGGLTPDLTVVLDIPESQFNRRERTRKLDRLERESSVFRRRVRNGYRTMSRREPKTVLIDGRQSRGEVESDIWRLVERVIGKRK